MFDDQIILENFKKEALKILKNDGEGTAQERLDKLKALINSQTFSTALEIDRSSDNSSYKSAYLAVWAQKKNGLIFENKNGKYLLNLGYTAALFTAPNAGMALKKCTNLKAACEYVIGIIDTYSKHIPGQEKWVPSPKIENPEPDTPLSLFRAAALKILESEEEITVKERLEQLKTLCNKQKFATEFEIDKSPDGKYFAGKHTAQKQRDRKSPLFEYINGNPCLKLDCTLPLFSRVTKTTLNADTLEELWSYVVGLIHEYEEYASATEKWVPHPQIEHPSPITPLSIFKEDAANILQGSEKITVQMRLEKLKALLNEQEFDTELEIGKLANPNYFKGKDVIRGQFSRSDLFEHVDEAYRLKLEAVTPLLIGTNVHALADTNTLEDACNYIIGLIHEYGKYTDSKEKWVPQPQVKHPTQPTPLSLFIHNAFQILMDSKKTNIQERLNKLKELVNQQTSFPEFKLTKTEKDPKYWIGYKAIVGHKKNSRLFNKVDTEYYLKLDYEDALLISPTAGLALKKADTLENACNYVTGLIHACEKYIVGVEPWIPQVGTTADASDVDMEDDSEDEINDAIDSESRKSKKRKRSEIDTVENPLAMLNKQAIGALLARSGGKTECIQFTSTQYDAVRKLQLAPVEILGKVSNYGVFAHGDEGFKPGETICGYSGEEYSSLDGVTYSDYILEIEEGHYIDAAMSGNIGGFINHSFSPNATFKIVGNKYGKKIAKIVALKPIMPGEQILIDYGSSYLRKGKLIFLNKFDSYLSAHEFYLKNKEYYIEPSQTHLRILEEKGLISLPTTCDRVRIPKILFEMLQPLSFWDFLQKDCKTEVDLPIIEFDSNGQALPNNEQRCITTLMVAVSLEKEKEVKKLLELDADPNFQDRRGKTALYYALEKANRNDFSVNMLLTYGAKQSLFDTDHLSPLHICVQSGNIVGARTIINTHIKNNDYYAEQLSLMADSHYDPLLFALMLNQIEIFEELLMTIINNESQNGSPSYSCIDKLMWITCNGPSFVEVCQTISLNTWKNLVDLSIKYRLLQHENYAESLIEELGERCKQTKISEEESIILELLNLITNNMGENATASAAAVENITINQVPDITMNSPEAESETGDKDKMNEDSDEEILLINIPGLTFFSPEIPSPKKPKTHESEDRNANHDENPAAYSDTPTNQTPPLDDDDDILLLEDPFCSPST